MPTAARASSRSSCAAGKLRTPMWRSSSVRRSVAAAFLAGLVAAAAVFATSSYAGGRAGIPRGDRPGWQRVFADDFTGKRLNGSKWGAYSGQPGGDPGGWWDPSHVVVRRGVLDLETYRDPRFGGRWVSGGVSSAPGLKQTYGKYLVRFRIDRGKGVAAILLLWPSGEHWPPEIDFAEDGGETNSRNHLAATLHYGSSDDQIQRTVRGDFSRWHT